MTTTTKARAAAKAAATPKPAGKSAAKVAAAAPPAANKIDTLIGLLQGQHGATLQAMVDATGWQKHSVRGAISGTLKKARGLVVTSEKTEAGRVYRIAARVQA